MARRIRLCFPAENVAAIAELREEEAHATCAAVWEALPAAGEAHHAIYSGSECVLLLPEVVRVAKENATYDVSPGDVGFAWFEPGDSWVVETAFAEICWFYGRDARPSMPEGPTPVNMFARIMEGADAFYAVCRKMRREGVKAFEITKLENEVAV
jgi:hypothetical protein